VLLSVSIWIAGRRGHPGTSRRVLRTVGTSIGFLVGTIVIGNLAVPFFLQLVQMLRTQGDSHFPRFLLLPWLCCGTTGISQPSYQRHCCGTGRAIERHTTRGTTSPSDRFSSAIFFWPVGAGVNPSPLLKQQALLHSGYSSYPDLLCQSRIGVNRPLVHTG